MTVKGEEIAKLREFTAWTASFSALTLVIVSFTVERFRLTDRVTGSLVSIMLMIAALILFFASDRYVRHLLFSQGSETNFYRKASLIAGIGIPILGLIAGLMIGPPDGPFTTFSFMIIALSSLGSAWKRFIDKIEGKLNLSEDKKRS